MSTEEVTGELLKCCGSANWARQVANARPFQNEEQLLDTADRVWRELKQEDWLEAFRHHPQIGENVGEKISERPSAASRSAEAVRWAREEQSATRDATPKMLDSLALANREYQARFGYIFIVCATGKTTEQMLALLQQRLQNGPGAEIAIAAGEQSRITCLRLRKLLGGE